MKILNVNVVEEFNNSFGFSCALGTYRIHANGRVQKNFGDRTAACGYHSLTIKGGEALRAHRIVTAFRAA